MCTEKEEGILGWFEVPVNERLWFHAVEIGDALRALETPTHCMGGCVTGKGLRSMQDCGRKGGSG